MYGNVTTAGDCASLCGRDSRCVGFVSEPACAVLYQLVVTDTLIDAVSYTRNASAPDPSCVRANSSLVQLFVRRAADNLTSVVHVLDYGYTVAPPLPAEPILITLAQPLWPRVACAQLAVAVFTPSSNVSAPIQLACPGGDGGDYYATLLLTAPPAPWTVLLLSQQRQREEEK